MGRPATSTAFGLRQRLDACAGSRVCRRQLCQLPGRIRGAESMLVTTNIREDWRRVRRLCCTGFARQQPRVDAGGVEGGAPALVRRQVEQDLRAAVGGEPAVPGHFLVELTLAPP